ncbi:MAG: hypothetical protein N2234_07995 [Planctomycetota bacterium]|nr:hypothetical protein [Planctomycetota bacterium]
MRPSGRGFDSPRLHFLFFLAYFYLSAFVCVQVLDFPNFTNNSIRISLLIRASLSRFLL